MRKSKVIITIYGTEQICASCVGAPGSKDTYEWLQAAIRRKYIDDEISYKYIDFNQPQRDESHKTFIERIVDEDLFWPIVMVNDELVAEGIPRLKTIYESLDEHGIELKSS
ncbi:YuzD family protein [Oceanobacillus bengalensis]|uniref:DUF1462 family protein n=1 Tax=Oceanobacillus bengalensis TaxID=1435466 RepID=A0A494YW84_9BACI|nr:YuzD family protein [Oceanobacillus bengalensis]RKQ14485.1 DUF1462 family protein [Oceanobacillus bengalensis]